MHYKIIWNLEAHNSLRKNLKYLSKNWTKREIKNFLNEVDYKIKLIGNNAYSGTLFELKPTLRRIIITKHITLFYEVDDTNNKIYLHLFWLNFKDPKLLKKFFS